MGGVETAENAEPFSGGKIYQRRARMALPLLVRQAKVQKTIFYADLAEELGMPNPKNLNFVLGGMGQSILQLQKERIEDIPPILCQALLEAFDVVGGEQCTHLRDGDFV